MRRICIFFIVKFRLIIAIIIIIYKFLNFINKLSFILVIHTSLSL